MPSRQSKGRAIGQRNLQVASSSPLAPKAGADYLEHVSIIARRTLREFWDQRSHRDAEQPLRAWFAEVRRAVWRTPADIKLAHRNASFVGSDRVVFNVGGNKYRLVVAVKYSAQLVFIRFVGTHAEYDDIDAEEV
jgi:mRNA interferase HigB